MSEITIPISERFKKYIPIVTGICVIISIVLFIGINTEQDPENWDAFAKWGVPATQDIFKGSYWGLITSNFLHLDIVHIIANVYWFWIFGKKIEFEEGELFFGTFIVSAAVISSLAQLSFSETTGIGLSGIVYAFFGYIFTKRKITEAYKNTLTKKIIYLFILWLFLCIILTETGVWEVANAAHVFGLLFGILLGYIAEFSKIKQGIIGVLCILLVGSSIFWNPFSISWLSYKVYIAYENQDTEEARLLYNQILERDSDNEFALSNLKELEIIELSDKAYELHANEEYEKAKEVYIQILNIDEKNEWALENLLRMPEE
ncbi:rhomboid family intramembrane serine protease [uncultured Dokdonia sp.]|uniref:rhomboid family protein n=1 Tax=uncultured Dokdonia sp. TaxID=575653 RepID=UPI002619A2AD|nr:rhomboid family intramembrane serine protease [uncultured Dokdonia sp.]